MKLTRVLSLVLVALLLAACLSSCGLVEDIKSMFGMETQPVDDPADDIPENQEYKLVSNGAPQYIIVYDYKAGPQTKNAVLTMVEAFKTRLNCTIEARECYSDRVVDEDIVQEKEILIGNTNRPESAILSDNMKTNDSDVDVINGKVVIAGGSDAATAKAVSTFISGFVYRQGELNANENGKKLSLYVCKNVVVPENAEDPNYAERSEKSKYDVDHDDFTSKGTYSYNVATMANARLDSYLLVYAREGAQKETSRTFALGLQDYIYKEVGFELDVKKDAAIIRADYKIVVGDTTFTDDALAESLGDNEYYIALVNEESTLADGSTAKGATLYILFGDNAYDAAMAAFKRVMPHSASPIDFNMSAGFVETNMANPPKAE